MYRYIEGGERERESGPAIQTSYSSEKAPSAAAADYYYYNAAQSWSRDRQRSFAVQALQRVCTALCIVGFVYCIARRVYWRVHNVVL